MTFSSDGSRIHSASENEQLVWDFATLQTIQDAFWEPPKEPTLTFPDGRWFVTSESSNVVLVDLKYKHTSDEAAYRKIKASFDWLWHEEQDTDLLALRNRDDSKLLIADLEKTAEPKQTPELDQTLEPPK